MHTVTSMIHLSLPFLPHLLSSPFSLLYAAHPVCRSFSFLASHPPRFAPSCLPTSSRLLPRTLCPSCPLPLCFVSVPASLVPRTGALSLPPLRSPSPSGALRARGSERRDRSDRPPHRRPPRPCSRRPTHPLAGAAKAPCPPTRPPTTASAPRAEATLLPCLNTKHARE